MKTLIVIPTRDRPNALKRLLSTLKNSDHSCNIVIMVDERSSALSNNQNISNNFECKYITHKVSGLNNIYNLGVEHNPNYERYIFLNDDCFVKDKNWYKKLGIIYTTTHPKLITFSNPNSYSALCISKKVLEEIGYFDKIYISGGHEDSDLSLELGNLYCKTYPKDPKKEGIIVGANLISHDSRLNGNSTRWDHGINKKQFDKKWKKCSPSEGIKSKGGKYEGFYKKISL